MTTTPPTVHQPTLFDDPPPRKITGWHRPDGAACYRPDCDDPAHVTDPAELAVPGPYPIPVPERYHEGKSARWIEASRYVPADPTSLAFLDFHDRHPDVYAYLVNLARNARRRGVERLGVQMLWEVLRWNVTLGNLPDPAEAYKLNNNYASRYARLIMAQEADLADVFETRQLRSE